MRVIGLLIATISLATAASASETVIIQGDDAYPPYSYVENGQYKGIYVDLINLAAKQLAPQYTVVLEPTPWKRGLKNLERGQSLGLFPAYRIKERTYISEYSTTLYRETVALFCTAAVMAKSPHTFPDDFAGLIIGTNLGFALGEQMTAAVNAKVFTFSESLGNQANLLKLQAGEIDCYANDRLAVHYSYNSLLAKQRQHKLTRFNGFRLQQAVEVSQEDAFIAYSAANSVSYKSDFILKMNAALQQLIESGQLGPLIGRTIAAQSPSRAD